MSTLAIPNLKYRGACRDEDPDLHYPVGNTGPALLQIEEAKAVCRRCPVMEQCLEWALDNGEEWGIWGGLSEDERRSMKRRTARRKLQGCGSPAGYKRHITLGEEPCQSCQDANAAYLSPEGLSTRERQVLAELAKGASRDQIALRLGLAPKTVKDHILRLRAVFGDLADHDIPKAARRAGLLTGTDTEVAA